MLLSTLLPFYQKIGADTNLSHIKAYPLCYSYIFVSYFTGVGNTVRNASGLSYSRKHKLLGQNYLNLNSWSKYYCKEEYRQCHSYFLYYLTSFCPFSHNIFSAHFLIKSPILTASSGSIKVSITFSLCCTNMYSILVIFRSTLFYKYSHISLLSACTKIFLLDRDLLSFSFRRMYAIANIFYIRQYRYISSYGWLRCIFIFIIGRNISSSFFSCPHWVCLSYSS